MAAPSDEIILEALAVLRFALPFKEVMAIAKRIGQRRIDGDKLKSLPKEQYT